MHNDFRAILNKGERPSTGSASVFPVFMIALINTVSNEVTKYGLKRNKPLKYKADREKEVFHLLKISALINTLLIIPIFILMLSSLTEPNFEIVGFVVWSVK